MTPTTRTSAKKLAAIEKCDAEPPNIRSRLPKGVSTESKAPEPTTTRDIRRFQIANCGSRIERTFVIRALYFVLRIWCFVFGALYLVLCTWCFVLGALYFLPTASCLLPLAFCLLLSAFCSLPSATAYFLSASGRRGILDHSVPDRGRNCRDDH